MMLVTIVAPAACKEGILIMKIAKRLASICSLFIAPAILVIAEQVVPGMDVTAAPAVHVSIATDQAKIPTPPGGWADFSTLEPNDPRIRISADDAAAVAVSRFGLEPSAVDETVGVVPAMAKVEIVPTMQLAPSWVVTADVAMSAGMGRYVGERLCIVIDATTGEYRYAYLADFVPSAGI
jgi:hypothetical protein